MQNLSISLLQTSLDWESPEANRIRLSSLLENVPASDLIFLPEMFTSGFTMNPAGVAESMEGETVAWMQAQSQKHDAGLGGSLVIRESGTYRNRFVLVSPGGQLRHYDKRHLFRMAGEHEVYAQGNARTLARVKGWNVLLQVCYDLRFPVYSRNTPGSGLRGEYDLAVYVANWPERRAAHWKALGVARAIENQCWVAMVNRVGTDGNGIAYSGDSMIIAPDGEVVVSLSQQEGILSRELDAGRLLEWREKFPAWRDADAFSLS